LAEEENRDRFINWKQKTLIYDLQNFLTRSPVMEAFSQLLPSLGLQSRRMVITLSASL
jgi:hypothetical protein